MTLTTHSTEVPAPAPPQIDMSRLRKVQPHEYMVRFCFGAAVSVVAAILGLAVDERMSGLFLAFPAILPATLTLLERKDGAAQAISDVRGAAIGAIAMLAFALVSLVLVVRVPALSLPAALATWVVASLGIYMLLRTFVRMVGERQYLPEVPAVEAEAVMNTLRSHGFTIAVAESCTGGLVGALLTNVPGASDVVRGAVVAYTDQVKTDVLGVPAQLIEERTAVSAGVAREMATGVKGRFTADVGLSVTGYLGTARDDASGGKTYIALALPDNRVLIRHYEDDQGPGRNRERDVRMALRLITEAIGAER